MSEEIKGKMKQNCENHERCMEMIQAVLDGSATPEELAHFEKEMDHCLPCIEGYELQKTMKEALSSKVDKKCCPEATIKKIKASVGLTMVVLGFVALEVKLIELIF